MIESSNYASIVHSFVSSLGVSHDKIESLMS